MALPQKENTGPTYACTFTAVFIQNVVVLFHT